MKIVKTLAIAYLAWAIFYSLVFGTFWAINALGFKLNGGPQLVSQLNRDGFSVYNAQVDDGNKWLSLSLSKKESTHGRLIYAWTKDAGAKIIDIFNANKKDNPPKYKHGIRVEKGWALWIGLDEADGGKFATLKNAADKLKIKPKKHIWYPKVELTFLSTLLQRQIVSDWLLPEVFIPLILILRKIFIYPVLLPFVYSVALSPPQIAWVTSFLPILFYGGLFFLVRRRFEKE